MFSNPYPNGGQSSCGGAVEYAQVRMQPELFNEPQCWGALLNGGLMCSPGFAPGKLHFKNKYCDNCRNCIMVPVTHIRALTKEQQEEATNRRSEGFWNQAPAAMGAGLYRIINNTATCSGPWLALFREPPPAILWPDLPDDWVCDGHVRLCVAKGTLVPAKTLRCARRCKRPCSSRPCQLSATSASLSCRTT